MFARASSSVSPSDTQPGSSGHTAEWSSVSGSCSRTTVNVIPTVQAGRREWRLNGGIRRWTARTLKSHNLWPAWIHFRESGVTRPSGGDLADCRCQADLSFLMVACTELEGAFVSTRTFPDGEGMPSRSLP